MRKMKQSIRTLDDIHMTLTYQKNAFEMVRSSETFRHSDNGVCIAFSKSIYDTVCRTTALKAVMLRKLINTCCACILVRYPSVQQSRAQ